MPGRALRPLSAIHSTLRPVPRHWRTAGPDRATFQPIVKKARAMHGLIVRKRRRLHAFRLQLPNLCAAMALSRYYQEAPMIRPIRLFIVLAIGLSVAGCHDGRYHHHHHHGYDGYHRGGYGSGYGGPGRGYGGPYMGGGGMGRP